jgi:hypothetical protein
MEGVKQVTVTIGAGSVVIPLVPDDDEPAPDNSNNSLDKIMRKPGPTKSRSGRGA